MEGEKDGEREESKRMGGRSGRVKRMAREGGVGGKEE